MPGGDKVPKKTRKTVRIKHLSLSNSNSNTKKQKQKQTLKKPTGKFWNSSSSNSRSSNSSNSSNSSSSSHSRHSSHSRKKLPPTQIQKIKFTGRYWNPVKDLSSSRSSSRSSNSSSYNVSSVSSVNSAPRKLVQSQRPPHNASAPTLKPTVIVSNSNSHKNFRHLKTRKLKTPHRYKPKTNP